MKKSSTEKRSPKTVAKESVRWVTIGMDLGDKSSQVCGLNAAGEAVGEQSIATTKKALLRFFANRARCRVAMEVGTHSPWVSRLLKQLGHEVFVANPRQVRLISEISRKNDKVDARLLAKLARLDPELLRPIRHRSEEAVSVKARVT